MEFNTLDDFDVRDKTVLVRVDINSPMDLESGEIIDDNRIRKSIPTLKELSEKGAKVVVIAHQGRPGSDDFTTMEKHAEKMSQIMDIEVHYIDDVFGPAAREAISNLDRGDILLLENARFYSEEVLNRPPEKQAETHFVRKLSPLGDLFVNDAFAASHRSQPSLVGFGVNLPAVAGRLMESEIEGLGKSLDPDHPCVHVLGGAKADDSLNLIEHVFERGLADQILVGGLVGQIFLAAKGYDLGEANMNVLSEEGLEGEIERAENLLSDYEEKIVMPTDFRVEINDGEAEVIGPEELPTDKPIYDIGDETIENFAEIIKHAKTVIANGPLGVFEKPAFAVGTSRILGEIAESNAFTTIGGGHLVAVARDQNLTQEIDHVSTGGGACLNFLAGEKLPVIELLRRAAKK